MNRTKRLKDYVVEGNQLDLKKKLDKAIKKSRYINRWIEKNLRRDEKRVVLSNLLLSTADYLEVTKSSLNLHVSVLALSTRSLYEINVRLRTVIEDELELGNWQSESVIDKVQTLEGLLLLSDPSENNSGQVILRQEIERLKGLISKYRLPTIKQPTSTGKLVKLVGLESEHKALYKLYSKLVHPSSYLVNDYGNASAIENQKILQIHAQLYAHDTISRVCEELGVPYEISKPYGEA
ncbi:MAG: hypothetical protein HRU05_19060 [Oceanospirillaceae bacterium]|nr:hypothetical protein [Oceanospirillaceae bacterium]